MLEALVMNKSHRAVALARIQQRIRTALLIAPTHLALNVALSRIDNAAIDFNGLLREIITSDPVFFLLISRSLALLKRGGTKRGSFFAIHIGLAEFCAEIFNLELYSAELDNVSFFQAIVLRTFIVQKAYSLGRGAFQIANDDKHLVVHIFIKLLRLLEGTI